MAIALAHASVEQQAAVRRTAADLAAPYWSGEVLEMPGRALLVSGRR